MDSSLTDLVNNKRVLFVSVKTFDYEKHIVNCLTRNGAIVDYYDERPKNSIIVKGIIRIKRDLYQFKINQYYNRILAEIRGNSYDYFFVLRGEVVPDFFIKEVRKRNPHCHFIFYTWDSIKNNHHAKSVLDLFDACYTFDPQDASDLKIYHRPLFFIDAYDKVEAKTTYKYKMLFIGTTHSDRYTISSYISNILVDKGYNTYAYYFMQGKSVLLYKRLFDKTFQQVDPKKLSYQSIGLSEIIELYEDSEIILDIQHPGQSGLTMRTFEALGAGKKIITTNPLVKNYSFYNPENILVIDRTNIQLPTYFLTSSFQPLLEEVREQMKIESWLADLFTKHYKDTWLK